MRIDVVRPWIGPASLTAALLVSAVAFASPPRYVDLPTPEHARGGSSASPKTQAAPSRANKNDWADDQGQSAAEDIVRARALEEGRDPNEAVEALRRGEPQPQARFKGQPDAKEDGKPTRKWVRHRVIGGERLDDIADRYGVRKSSLVQWNKLDPSKPFLRAGQTLRVYAARTPPPREEFLYTVKRGDTWDKIARAHGVDADVLRKRWNPRVPQRFKAGQEIVIWVEGTPEPQEGELPPEEIEELEGVAATPSTARRSPIGSGRPLPLKPIRSGSFAVGAPNKGRLSGSAILPPNDQLYSLMRPENAYGTTHALNHLQLAIARWRRDFGFVGKLVIGDISKRGGGRLSPHSSHRTGRDVDIRLPLSGDTIDWEASWALVHELVKTGQVEYIFLGTAQQKVLHRVARRAGVKNAELEKILQYPHAAKTNHGLVRHAAGHSTHIHVRFTCGPGSPACKSY